MDAAPCLLAELPPLAGASAGWLALLGALGVVLVARGARMLPLLVLVAGGIAGWAVGIRIHQSFALRVPEWGAALAAAVIVATLSVVFLRIGVAWMMALLASALCVLLSCTMIDRGILNPSPTPIVRGGAALTDGSSAPMLGDAEPTPRDLAPTLLDALARSWNDAATDAGFVARTTDAWRHMRARTDAWWARLPSATQTLVSAFGWGGFAAGFIAAIFFVVGQATEEPEKVARAFVAATSTGDFAAAHALYSAPLKERQSLAQLQDAAAATPSLLQCRAHQWALRCWIVCLWTIICLPA